jgi:hypothetical protein
VGSAGRGGLERWRRARVAGARRQASTVEAGVGGGRPMQQIKIRSAAAGSARPRRSRLLDPPRIMRLRRRRGGVAGSGLGMGTTIVEKSGFRYDGNLV